MEVKERENKIKEDYKKDIIEEEKTNKNVELLM